MNKPALALIIILSLLTSCSSLHSVKTADTHASMPLFDGASLGKWQPMAMQHLGDIEVRDSAIVLHRGGFFTGVTWSGPVLTMNYELELQAKRIEGLDFFCGLTFPFDKTFASLIIGGWGGYTTGVSSINGVDASENGTADAVMFEDNVWYRIRLRVTPNRIRAWVDDRNIVDLDTSGKQIDLRSDVDVTKPLSIMTYNTTGAVKNIVLTKL